MTGEDSLVHPLDRLKFGALGIWRSLALDPNNAVVWRRKEIRSDGAVITQRGKHWLIRTDVCAITIHGDTGTMIITHRER